LKFLEAVFAPPSPRERVGERGIKILSFFKRFYSKNCNEL